MTNEQHALVLEQLSWQHKAKSLPHDALIAGAAALRAPQGWLPIATALKDRRRLLLWVADEMGGYEVQVGSYDDDYLAAVSVPFWRYDGDVDHAAYSRAHQPTHWQPLPLPPVSPATEPQEDKDHGEPRPSNAEIVALILKAANQPEMPPKPWIEWVVAFTRQIVSAAPSSATEQE